MRLSIIIPAFNEEKELPRCLESVRAAIAAAGAGEGEVEMVVCDNNSTDRTAEVAAQGGARVVFEPFNQIGRARNAGAAAAAGEWLLFIDADSRLAAENLRRVLELARTDSPAVGGGCVIWMEGLPWWAAPSVAMWNAVSVAARLAAGSFVFCRAEAFRAVGGFSAELFAAEELDLSKKLRRWGKGRGWRFVIFRGRPHVSSSRKFHAHGPWELLKLLGGFALNFRRLTRRREALDFFYDGKR